MFEAFARRDTETAFELYDSEVVWDSRAMTGFQDLQGVYRGHDGVRAWWRSWLDAWETIEFVPEATEHVEHGNQVVSSWVQRNRGRGSGVEVDMESAVVWTFENGRIVRAAVFTSRAEARQAVGLPSA